MKRDLPHCGQFQKGANVPMTTETYHRLSLELRMAGEALIASPSVATYNQLSKMLAALTRGGMEGGAMDLGSNTMVLICDRYEAPRVISTTDAEAGQLRTAIMSIEAALPQMPLNRFSQAVAEVEAFCAVVAPDEQPTEEKQ